MLRSFLSNHVLANLSFVLVLVLGVLAYFNMPIARDPDINFNWINISTVLPGAASIDVEKRITDPIEDTINRNIKDIRFVSSTSRDGISSILVRFNQLNDDDFRERVADLRREVQNVYTDQLPKEAIDPKVVEITTSSGYPTAVVALTTSSDDDDFRRYAETLKKDIERLPGVDEALLQGVEDPELHIRFYPDRLEGMGVSPTDLANTVREYFRDVSIGDLETDEGRWVVRLEGTSGSIDDLEKFPVVSARGVVELGALADIYRASAEPAMLVRFKGESAVMFSVTKQEGVNTLELLDKLREFLDQQNQTFNNSGYQLTLVDDQTVSTREAIGQMQQNALIGLLLVVLVAFLFLGTRIALLISVGIPFTLAATFLILNLMGIQLTNAVLLGVVIALGMLVDDAVVVVETIYYRLQRGEQAMDASIAALREVGAPVFTSVLTTISVFLPLMLLPGILGQFLRIIPLVVCTALLLSLIEAFWMLPAHVTALGVNFRRESRLQQHRRRLTQKLRHGYGLLLMRAMRYPWRTLVSIAVTLIVAVILLMAGAVKINFFASDPFRVIYVNIEMPTNANLNATLDVATVMNKKAIAALEEGELRESIVYSGQMLTITEPIFGNNYGQVFISLNAHRANMRDTYATIAAVEKAVGTAYGDAKISVLVVEDGPPLGQSINIKVRGRDFDTIQAAVDDLIDHMQTLGLFKNINVDFKPGSPELKLSLNGDAIKRAGLSPTLVTSTLQSYVDGILVGSYQSSGEEVDIRLLTNQNEHDLDTLLQQTLLTQSGEPVQLRELLHAEYQYGYQNIRHYNFMRSVTLGADILDDKTDTVAANAVLRDYWQTARIKHPGIELEFSGELDDIVESLNGIVMMFVMGIGLIYLILGTQFKSYSQPILILVAVPLAFIGVVYGLAVTGNPLSMITMYGIVALAGIAVNSAIVLISAANERLEKNMGPMHATIYAARRRVIPIVITSTTTIAGLFSLAAGVGGKSLLWGPIATAIVSGLLVSTVLVLIVVPLLFYASVTLHPWRALRRWVVMLARKAGVG